MCTTDPGASRRPIVLDYTDVGDAGAYRDPHCACAGAFPPVSGIARPGGRRTSSKTQQKEKEGNNQSTQFVYPTTDDATPRTVADPSFPPQQPTSQTQAGYYGQQQQSMAHNPYAAMWPQVREGEIHLSPSRRRNSLTPHLTRPAGGKV